MPPRLEDVRRELCGRSAAYFIDQWVQVEDKAGGRWIPFALWDTQREVLSVVEASRFTIALKARQLGFTWLVLGFSLWLLVFKRGAVLLFSQREDDAHELMRRLQEMHARLPDWLRQKVTADSKSELTLADGASALAFPTSGRVGRSYTASFVLIDEADHVGDLQALLNAVKPTVDAGGQLVMLSTADKSRPQSPFKRIYTAAKKGENNYTPIFYGWRARPGRTDEWYQEEARSILAQTGSLDDLHQEYPATDVEALAPRSLDKRIPPAWLQQCYREQVPLTKLPQNVPAIPGLEVYSLPVPGRLYVIGGDPAEGNPTSDDSALTVLDAGSGEEIAALAGRHQPSAFAGYIDDIGRWLGCCAVMVERNNHGHAVLLWLEANSSLPMLCGHDGRVGWMSSQKGKALLYSAAADAFRHQETILHSFASLLQLQSVEGATLRAPDGERDDRADAYALALIGGRLALAAMQQDERTTIIHA